MSAVAATAPARAEAYRAKGWWRDETILDDLRRAIAASPERPAIIAARAFARDRITIGYAELGALVERFAGALLALGVRRGAVVAVQLPNWWQFNALALACARIGAVFAPMPVDYRRREVEFILRRTEAQVYVGPGSWLGFSHQALLRELAPALPSLRRRVILGPEGALADAEVDLDRHFADRRWEDEHRPEELDALESSADEPFMIMYTSGTTGEPKGVVHSLNTLYAIARAMSETMAMGPSDVVTTPSALAGLVGFNYNFQVPLLVGATAVFQDVGDPDLALSLMETYRVTFMYAIPTFLLTLLSAQERKKRKLDALKGFVTGSTPVPPHLIAAIRGAFGVRLHTLWGMTENGGVTLTRLDDPADWPASCDGTPVPWMDVKIVPAVAADGTAFPAGTGRLLVRGANQCLGYYKRDDLYAACVDGEGWFDTGDLARWVDRGGIRIVGRLKEVIFRHGQKIPVVEVESALYSHPGIREVALVADADESVGEHVCAVVVAKEGAPTLRDLRDHLAGLGMAAQYWPDRLELIDAMPKTATGKIQRFVLKDMLAAKRAATP